MGFTPSHVTHNPKYSISVHPKKDFSIHTGGGKPLPPTVTSVWNSGAVAVPKKIALAHIAVQERGGEEATEFGGAGGKVGNLEVAQRLWTHPRDSHVFQVPRESDIGGGRWFYGGDLESDEGTGGLEEDDEYPEQGGGEAAGVRIFLKIRRTVGVAIRCRDGGGYPPHMMGPWRFPGPGGTDTDMAAPTLEVRQEVGVHLSGGGKTGGNDWADGDIHSAKPEYGRAVYCYTFASGPLWGGRE